ncbi:hypothetical protein ACFQX6_03275 [Streptosporangium lutulentum]
MNRFLRESLHPEDARDPEIRALVEQHFARSHHGNDEMLASLQDNIEQTAAARIKGVDLAPLSPLIGYLQTGQLNAVSMRVPGRSGDYLVLFEDEMLLFASKLSKAVAWAIPCGPSDANGMMTFEWGMPPVTERIEARPEVAEQFADIVITYAVTGGVGQAAHHMVPPGYLNLASMMRDSLEYFVLGHEYSHILLGHLDIAESRKGVLPASEAEVLAYSWRQELDADWFGMVLSINALIDHEDQDIPFGFIGISLFFDALDVMDRAVALLQTGDENARQLGSHPPSDLRKRYLRDFLPQMAGGDPELSEDVRTALELADVQSEIIRLLWERTRPILLDLRRHGVSVAPTWRTIPKEAGDETVPGP